MHNYKYDYLVFIGRFQPFHSGHAHVAKEALKLSDKLIFVIGSHDKPRDTRNPLTTAERISIIKRDLDWKASAILANNRLFFAPQVDYTYNDEKWIAAIQSAVEAIVVQTYPGRWSTGETPRVGIVGFDKDHSSYYLKKFPQWKLEAIEPKNALNATDIRDTLLGGYGLGDTYRDYFTSEDQMEFVERIFSSNALEIVRSERTFIEKYKQQWANVPYPVTFNCVDAVVTQSGHLLVVERGAMPGEGQWAMPGGFLNQNETHKEGAIRELYEETKIDVPKPALAGSIVKVKGYDDPHRSARGRTLTQAFHFKLNDAFELPKIKGSDDARKAHWITFHEFANSRSKFFEDHFSIISDMLGI
jgi:bifunctional NMN adenylyltransferase/nudix hydrolase